MKPGAELVAQLFGWRFHFAADLDAVTMNGQGTGVFAYVCHVIDREGCTVGQGRGMAELRETDMLNGNKAVKMALKRAQVDAILRCAALSQWFTQDLEEPQYIAPAAAPEPPAGNGHVPGPAAATPAECQDIRTLLKVTRRTETEILRHYGVDRLEELQSAVAQQLILRLLEIRQARTRHPHDSPHR